MKTLAKALLFPFYLAGVILVGLLAPGGDVPPMALAAGGENLGHVERVQGVAYAVQGTELRQLAPGVLVRRGDVLKTGPRARLLVVMLDEARLTLGADAAVALERYDLGRDDGLARLRLDKGALKVEQSAQSVRRESFELATAVGTIGGRAQDFWAGFLAEGELSVILLEGRGLSITNNAGTGAIKYAHYGAVLRSLSEPPPAATLWNPQRMDKANLTVTFD